MKKMILGLMMLAATGISSVFAGEGEVSKQVLKAFQSEFTDATEVSWSEGSNYYRAGFTMNTMKVFAYYTKAGDLIGVARYISPLQLPLHLLTHLKKEYNHYWVTDLFEMSNEDGTHYYVTVENNDTSVMLHSTNGSDWSTYNKSKKV